LPRVRTRTGPDGARLGEGLTSARENAEAQERQRRQNSAQIFVLTPLHAESNAAYAAFVAYGKGSGHPAPLNFGDLFSYALAKTRALPLLF
jgi:uncharacterized protein with PIN domain